MSTKRNKKSVNKSRKNSIFSSNASVTIINEYRSFRFIGKKHLWRSLIVNVSFTTLEQFPLCCTSFTYLTFVQISSRIFYFVFFHKADAPKLKINWFYSFWIKTPLKNDQRFAFVRNINKFRTFWSIKIVANFPISNHILLWGRNLLTKKLNIENFAFIKSLQPFYNVCQKLWDKPPPISLSLPFEMKATQKEITFFPMRIIKMIFEMFRIKYWVHL